MATMNISLPDEMKQWVEDRASVGHFSNVSDYVRDVLRREQAAVERLQSTIDDAIASGFVEMSPEELFEDIKRHTRERIFEVAEEIRSESRKADDAA
jgi:antitoxin ParD1/3/4